MYINPDPHGADLTRAGYVKHRDDDDFMQPGILYREVLDDEGREHLVTNITNAMVGVHPETEERVYEYFTNVDPELGRRVREVFATKK